MQEAQRERADEHRQQCQRQMVLRIVEECRELVPDQHAGGNACRLCRDFVDAPRPAVRQAELSMMRRQAQASSCLVPASGSERPREPM